MTPERWGRLKSLFERARELDPSRLSEAIGPMCGGDPALQRDLRSLIDHHQVANSLLSGPIISRERMVEYLTTGLRTFQPGEILAARFRIDRFIAEGGMGEVYGAEDLDLREKIAIKTLRPALSSDTQLVDRFKQEIQIARKVTHRNVARVYDLFWHELAISDERRMAAFLTMELIDGETLTDRIRRLRRLREPDALPIIEQVLEGLGAAHAAGIVHGDLKSGNILLVTEGEVLRAAVTDFGLASSGDGPRVGLNDGRLAGTLAYMAPELFDGAPISIATDIFALGVVLFETVTGQLPFSGTSDDLVRRRTTVQVPSLRRLVPKIDARWESVIASCLAREPERRPKTAEAIRRNLRSHRRVTRRAAILFLGGLSATGVIRWVSRPKALNEEALRSFKRGSEFARRRNRDGLSNAIQEFRRAVNLEPGYADAWIGLADAYSAMGNFNFEDPKVALTNAKQAAGRAVSLQRGSGKALGVLAYVTSIDPRDWRHAEPYFKRAIAADPNQANIRLWYGAYLGKLGRSTEAIQQIRTGLNQDPSSLILNEQLAVELFRARRFREYYDQALELVRLQPFEASAHLALARALEWQGRFDEALQRCDVASQYGNAEEVLCFRAIIEAHRGNLKKAKNLADSIHAYWNRNPLETIQITALYCLLNEYGIALDLLEAGYARGDSTVLTAPTNPYLDPLLTEARYRQFLQQIGWI